MPLAIYVSFNKYLRLEPFLHQKVDAIALFHAWVLGSIVIEAENLSLQLPGIKFDVSHELGIDTKILLGIVDKLERQQELAEAEEYSRLSLSIGNVKDLVLKMCDHYKRTRATILFDDAALTLTPEYMVELFDVIRVLKHSRISPKASVYPGSTEYGPRFHANHEGKIISAWLPVDDDKYVPAMREIARKRFPSTRQISNDVDELFAYASFGIPRAYLMMLREYTESGSKRNQNDIRAIIQEHNKLRVTEFRSLSQKLPRFASLVDCGENLLANIVDALRVANQESDSHKQLVLGIETKGLTPIINRMINLLIEAGLLFEYKTEVSHGGTDRVYRRFTPDVGALIEVRAFSGKSRGNSPRQIVDFLQRPSAKHPVRRKIDTILNTNTIDALQFNLPPCNKCGTNRISDTQKFCHHCGAPLVVPSTFQTCMNAAIEVVPGLTEWQIAHLKEAGISTIEDFLAIQDPGTELRRIWQVGEKRAKQISDAIDVYVDEYLS